MTTPLDTITSAVLGNPFDPNKKPSRQGVVQAFSEMQLQLEAAQAGAFIKSTRTALNAMVIAPVSAMAWVVNDGTLANNGIYENTGTSTAAVWTRRTDIPQFCVSGLNVGAGTANAIRVTTDLPLPTQDGRCLIIVPIIATNTAAGPTVRFNGGADEPILTASGTAVVSGGLINGMLIAGFRAAGNFRMITDQASAAIVAQAQAYAAAAGSSATAAAASAAAAAATLAGSVKWTAANAVTNPDAAPIGVSSGTTNLVDGTSRNWHYYTDIRTDTNYAVQTAQCDTAVGLYYIRSKIAGTWSAWAKVQLGAVANQVTVGSIAELKTVDPALVTKIYLSSGARSGWFYWSAGDASGVPANDPGEGVYVTSTVLPVTSGMWARTFEGDVYPGWFGVNTDGSSSDVAFGRFFDFLVVWGKAGRLPPGKITMANSFTRNIGAGAISIIGAGKGISVIEFAGTTGGFYITHTSPGGQIINLMRWKSFTIQTTAAGAHGDALYIALNPVSASAVSMPVEIDDMEFRGDNPNTHFWSTSGVTLVDEWNSRVTNCLVKGLDDATEPFDQQNGIYLVRCNDCHIVRNHIYHVEYAVRLNTDAASYGDGNLIHDNRIVGVGYGVFLQGSVVVAQQGITSNHINAYSGGISTNNLCYTSIRDNLIFKTHLSTLNNWSGIVLTGTCNDNVVHGNQFSEPGAGAVATDFGIFMSGAFRTSIMGNQFTNCTATNFYPIYVASGDLHSIVGNIGDTTVDAGFIGGAAIPASYVAGNVRG